LVPEEEREGGGGEKGEREEAIAKRQLFNPIKQ
jgi:hypothetical protein